MTDSPSTHAMLREGVDRDRALSGTSGAPLLGCLFGLRGTGSGPQGEFTLAGDPGRPALAAGLGVTGLCMLADLALGGAARQRIGATRILQTMTLSLQLERLPGLGTSVHAVHEGSDGASIALTRGRIMEGQVYAGHSFAVFNVPAPSNVAPALPWEAGGEPGSQGATSQEPAPPWLARLLAAPAAVPGVPAWIDEEIRRACVPGDPNCATAALHANDLMLNRAGYVQGAVLAGAAALMASARAAVQVSALRSAHLTFVSPMRAEEPAAVHTDLLASPGRTAFVIARIRQSGRTVAEAAFLFRPG